MADCRIILADDHKIFRAGLKSLINKESTFKVVDEADDGEQLLNKLASSNANLLVLDLSMPKVDGITALKSIKTDFPKLKVLVLTMQKDPEHFRHAMYYGAAGYVLKDDAYEQLVMAIKMVLKGKQFVSPSVSRMINERQLRSMDDVENPSLEILTNRQKQILKLIAGGMANKNVAAKLKISIRTVETHRSHLTNKLGIKSTAGLVKYAIAKGLI